MADICIIYARPSKRTVAKVHALLSGRYEVWWDDDIRFGDYRGEIERQLSLSKCVVPVWDRISRADGDVLDEAEFSRKRGIPVLPVRIENIDPPLGYRSLHTIDLIGWDGRADDPRFQELLRNVEALLGSRSRLLTRPQSLTVSDRSVQLPTFFHSVSSYETQLRPEAAVQALSLLRTDAILVSAYDMVNDSSATRIAADLDRCRSNGSIVILDSGNYEAYRKTDAGWNIDGLRQAMATTPHDFAFCFDNVHPGAEVDAVVKDVLSAVERDSRNAPGVVMPIVHAPRTSGASYRSDLVPEIITRVARELQPTLIAVPERELGDGLFARARTVFSTRRALNELGYYQPLHLLGTGNPLTIAVLTAAGADCFDGLEWCRTVADHQTGLLYHFQQYEFFAWQSDVAASPIVRDAVKSPSVEFSGKVVFHNLEFFRAWLGELRDMVRNGRIDRFLTDKLPGGAKAVKQLETVIPEVFR